MRKWKATFVTGSTSASRPVMHTLELRLMIAENRPHLLIVQEAVELLHSVVTCPLSWDLVALREEDGKDLVNAS